MEALDSFRRRLEESFSRLTKSERRLATYYLQNYDEAAFLAAAEVAERLNVSEATVVRFARAAGFDGFPDLRRHLQDLLRTKATPATRLQRKLDALRNGGGHVLAKVVDMELKYLSETLRTVSQAEFDRAVDLVLNANRVFTLGLGSPRILAEMVEFRLRRFGVPTVSLTESGRDLLEKLILLDRGDIVVATVFQRVIPELVVVLDHAKKVGARSVLITDTLGLVLRDTADVILSARRGPVSTFHSLTVPMTILNALILAVAMARPESLTTLDRLQDLRATSGLD